VRVCRDNKTIRKTNRFNEHEYAYVTKQIEEHHISFAELGRSAILNQEIVSKLEIEMVYQVNKIGINLNQLAHHVNTKKCIDMEVIYRLVQMEKTLTRLLNGS
jgi:hypothetical protein